MKVAVLMGGGTSEHEISLLSGQAVCGALRERGHEVHELVLDSPVDLQAGLGAVTTEVVFIALHGGAGEDGRVQAALEQTSMPYVGSRPDPCAIAMDKARTKQLARELGVPVVDEAVFAADATDTAILDAAAALGPATVFKPVDEGSAVGVNLCDDLQSLARALAEVGRREGRWMLEPLVPGRELTVGVVCEQACPVIEIRPLHGFYDYVNKYTAGNTEYDCPADLPGPQAARVASDAMRLYRALELRDMARIDFRLDPARGHFLLEANTIPGMTATSLLPMGAAAIGMDFPTLCERLCQAAMERGADLQ
ncbi:D-alanine--D-alanine ligase [bacterium]|nr:MAG: D-alanine--D-alanine ligase [bacterium]